MQHVLKLKLETGIDQVIIGYPCYIDPENMLADVLAFDCRTITLLIESGAYLDLGGDDYFIVEDAAKQKLQRVRREDYPMYYRETFTETRCQKFNKAFMSRIFPEGFYINPYLEYSKLASSYINPKIIILHGEDWVDYTDNVRQFDNNSNLLYVTTEEFPEIDAIYNQLSKQFDI